MNEFYFRIIDSNLKTDLILKKDELHIKYQIFYDIILGKFLKYDLTNWLLMNTFIENMIRIKKFKILNKIFNDWNL